MKNKYLILTIVCVFQVEYCLSWDTDTLDETLTLLNSALDFVNTNYKNLSTDLNTSPRVVAGQLEVLLQRAEQNSLKVSDHHFNKIYYLKWYADLIASKALPFSIEEYGEETTSVLDMLSENFWVLFHETQNVDFTELDPVKNRTYTTWTESCLESYFAFGASKTNVRCSITVKCWDYLKAKGFLSYSASHQIFYIFIGQAEGCLTGSLRKFTNQLAKHVCSNILLENFVDFTTTVKFEKYFDILWERIAFCGMFGFHQFARLEWFEEGLKYRIPDYGCWSYDLYNGTTSNSGKTYLNYDLYNGTTYLSATEKKRGVRMEGGCDSHPTSVAMIALSQFIRYMLEELAES